MTVATAIPERVREASDAQRAVAVAPVTVPEDSENTSDDLWWLFVIWCLAL